MQTQIPAASQKIVPILKELETDIRNYYGSNLSKLVLYGSYARGTATENSDVDILLVLNRLNSPYKEINNINDIAVKFLLLYELNISLVPTTPNKLLEAETSFYKNINKEGIVL